jgi:uncharacterized repeat protein (TIGR01451 family)
MQHLKHLATCLILFSTTQLSAQIYFQLIQTDSNEWTVQAIVSEQVYPSTSTITGSAQVTIVTPVDISPNTLTNINGIWVKSPVVNGPMENPISAYTAFGLSQDNGISYQNGAITSLFSFQLNSSANLASIPKLICEDDPFIQTPNSAYIIANNEITVFDAMTVDIYEFAGVVGGCENAEIPKIFGVALLDSNEDCQKNETALPLVGWKVIATYDSGYALTTYTNHLGEYLLFAPVNGAYLTLSPPTELWNTCNNGNTLTFPSENAFDMLANSPVKCPHMTVDVQSNLIRRCTTNVYRINWCNNGTSLAENAFVIFKPHEAMTFMEASIGHEILPDGSLKFALGDVEVGACGSFNIKFQNSCDLDFGQAVCVEANIFPDKLCLGNSTVYEGASIFVDGSCTGDMVVFEIKNTGSADMAAPSNYKIIKDGEIIETGIFQLATNGTMPLTYPADGATYRLEAAQVAEFPITTSPSKTIETCSVVGGDFSTGFVMQFPFADYGHSHDQSCDIVVGSFDPNDKRGFPLGYGNKHKIEPNTPIEYMIRFQNTGTDTAFKVVILDTLPEHLNIESILPGSASHLYRLTILDEKVLEFTFDNIMLPDSNVNEPASHGFVTFTIRQQPDLPLGTTVNNSAAIYFDYNEPVITNTSTHLIAKDFVEISNSKDIQRPGLSLNVFPNPAKNLVNFQLSQTDFRTGQIELFNILGQKQRSLFFDGPTFTIERQGLPTGHYFYAIKLDGMPAANGKIKFMD